MEIITQRYRKETGKSAYKHNFFGKRIHNQDYVDWLEKQCTIPRVSVTLPNIDEINKVLKTQIEHLEYVEKLDGYEMVAYRRGFTYCLKWLGNKLTKGN